MATKVTYNGIPFSVVETVSMESMPIRDESNTDQLYTQFTYTCKGLYTTGLPPVPVGQNPINVITQLRHHLLQSRKELKIEVGQNILLQSKGVDAANGPKPVYCKIHHLHSESFMIEWSIQVCLLDCPEGAKGRVWLSNRYSMTTDIDERNYQVISINGTLVANSSLLGINGIDELRGLCVPPVIPGYERKTTYTVDKSGLTMQYTIRDQEIYMAPPKDVAKLSGNYTRSTNNSGATYSASIDLRLEGRREAPKAKLMALAFAIAANKFNSAKLPGQRWIPKDAMLRETLNDSVVELSIKALFVSDQQAANPLFFAGRAAAGAALTGGYLVSGVVGLAKAPDTIGKFGDDAQKAFSEYEKQAKQSKQPMQIGLNFAQFGGGLLGCVDPETGRRGAAVAPELYGSLPKLMMIAAAFTDPCADQFNVLRKEVERHRNRPNGLTSEFDVNDPLNPFSGGGRLLSDTSEFNRLSGSSQFLFSTGLSEVISQQPVANNNDPLPGIYEDYNIRYDFNADMGVSLLPSTNPGKPAAKIDYKSEIVQMVVHYDAQKLGFPPEVPRLEKSNGNMVLIKKVVRPEMPYTAPDGETLVYRTSGTLHYAFLDAAKVNISSPTPPWWPEETRKLVASTMYPVDEFPSKAMLSEEN